MRIGARSCAHRRVAELQLRRDPSSPSCRAARRGRRNRRSLDSVGRLGGVHRPDSGQQRLVALSAIGERFPLHCTANGKAILAGFSKEDAAPWSRRASRNILSIRSKIAPSFCGNLTRPTQTSSLRSGGARGRHQRRRRRRARRLWQVGCSVDSRADATLQRSARFARSGAACVPRKAAVDRR